MPGTGFRPTPCGHNGAMPTVFAVSGILWIIIVVLAVIGLIALLRGRM
jgi:hypothetical protein